MTLPWARLLLQKVGKRNFHTSKCTSLFFEFPDKDGYRQKSEEEINSKKWSVTKRALFELNLCKEGIKEWAEDLKDRVVTGPNVIIPEHEVDVVFRFTGDPEELNKWVITTDKDNNIGFSSAQLSFTPNSKGLFHGFLDTKVPPDGRIKKTGFCNCKLLPRLSPLKNPMRYEWDPYTHIVFHVRGDGRAYVINLHLQRCNDITMYDTYHYFLWTRGGPYWQHVRIPFSKFLFAYKGRVQSSNVSMPLDEVGAISFTIADKVTGPFRLEIDYIGVESDPSHIEDSAYEQYLVDEDQRFW